MDVPLEQLKVSGEGGEMMQPEVGDTVEITVRVIAINGDTATVEPEGAPEAENETESIKKSAEEADSMGY